MGRGVLPAYCAEKLWGELLATPAHLYFEPETTWKVLKESIQKVLIFSEGSRQKSHDFTSCSKILEQI